MPNIHDNEFKCNICDVARYRKCRSSNCNSIDNETDCGGMGYNFGQIVVNYIILVLKKVTKTN